MALDAATPRVVYTGNGSTDTFLVEDADSNAIYFASNSEIIVEKYTISTGVFTTLTEGVDYTLTGGPTTGSVVLTAGVLSALYKLIIYRQSTFDQSSSFGTSSSFSSSTHNTVTDRHRRLDQELKDKADRALKLDLAGVAYDAGAKQIKDVADPTDDQDVVTKAYFDDNSGTASATAAAASAVAADASADAAAASAAAAAASAVDANSVIDGLSFIWTFSATTAMADPGTGIVRFNNATLASVTAIAFDSLSANDGNPDVSAWLATLDDSTNTVKGSLRLAKRGAEQNWIDVNITAITANAGWTEVAVTYVASSGSFSAADELAVRFSRAGDQGLNGAGSGDLLAANNLSDVASAIAAYNNLHARGSDVASATTTNLSTATGFIVDVTGTTQIDAITLADGDRRLVRFTGILVLTHGASLVLPGGASITTAAGDVAEFVGYAAGVVRCINYQRAVFATQFADIKQAATDSATGVVELATVAEAGTGTDTSRAVTAAGLFPAEVNVASGTTTNIGAAASSSVNITGTTTITAFDTVAAGIFRRGRFAGILTFTHNGTSLILPSAANITTAANDRFEALSLGSGNWLVTAYTRADGTALVASSSAAASQAEQEAATSTTTYVSPGRQQYHPSAAKAWVQFNMSGTVADSYNVASVTDSGAGTWTVNIGTDFSSANYCVVVTSYDANAGDGQFSVIGVSAKAAGTATIINTRFTLPAAGGWTGATSGAADPSSSTVYAAFYGDQA